MPRESLSDLTFAGSAISPFEARVLGCLLEKEFSTPEIYPLTLNALVNACNQKNNRSPFMGLSPFEVEAALESLRLKRLAVLFSGADARVPKYRHTLDLIYPLEPVARALLTELLLRGPQTFAELRIRCERLTPLPRAEEIETLLSELSSLPSGALIRTLPRQPGQKETRWAQLLTGELPAPHETSPDPPIAPLALPAATEARLSRLESEIVLLRSQLAALRTSLGEP